LKEVTQVQHGFRWLLIPEIFPLRDW
jgi:hypothetical protein